MSAFSHKRKFVMPVDEAVAVPRDLFRDWNGYLIHCLSLTSGADIGHFQEGKEASKRR